MVTKKPGMESTSLLIEEKEEEEEENENNEQFGTKFFYSIFFKWKTELFHNFQMSKTVFFWNSEKKTYYQICKMRAHIKQKLRNKSNNKSFEWSWQIFICTHEKLCIRTYDRTYAGSMWKQLGSLLGNNAPTALKERKAKKVKAVVKGMKLFAQRIIFIVCFLPSSFSYLLVFSSYLSLFPYITFLLLSLFIHRYFTLLLLPHHFFIFSSLIFFYPSGWRRQHYSCILSRHRALVRKASTNYDAVRDEAYVRSRQGNCVLTKLFSFFSY